MTLSTINKTVALLIVAISLSQQNTHAESKTAQGVSFKHDITPILEEFCTRCHGEKKQKGNKKDTSTGDDTVSFD